MHANERLCDVLIDNLIQVECSKVIKHVVPNHFGGQALHLDKRQTQDDDRLDTGRDKPETLHRTAFPHLLANGCLRLTIDATKQLGENPKPARRVGISIEKVQNRFIMGLNTVSSCSLRSTRPPLMLPCAVWHGGSSCSIPQAQLCVDSRTSECASDMCESIC